MSRICRTDLVYRAISGTGQVLALVGLLALTPPGPVAAHQIDSSFLTVILRPDSLKLLVVIDESILLRGFNLDRNHDGILWREEMLAGVPEIFDFVAANLSVSADGAPLVLERLSGGVQPDNDGNIYVSVLWRAALAKPAVTLEVAASFFQRLGVDHKVLLKILRPDQPMLQAVLTADAPRQQFQVGQPETGILSEVKGILKGWLQ